MPRRSLYLLGSLAVLLGCTPWNNQPRCAPTMPWAGAPSNAPGVVYPPVSIPPPTVVYVPVVDREYTWNKLIDIVDDYFPRIDREQRVQQIGDVLTEGRIETQPLVGATLLEPHRSDSVGLYERSHATLQSLRRRGSLRVIPDAAGYRIEIQALKELEDVVRPEMSTAGAAVFRHDGSLERTASTATTGPGNTRWFPIGRDCALEQAIAEDIQGCLGGAATSAFAPPAIELPATAASSARRRAIVR